LLRMMPCLVAVLVAIGVSADAADESAEGVRIGVAPFERVAAKGAAVPDIASSLAQRLSTKGVERVVGPQGLGATASADPAAEDVVAWAKQAQVDLVVVGRTTRLGESLSVDARIRSAATGALLGSPLVVEASGPKDLGRAIEELATLVLEASRRDQVGAPTRLARRPDTGSATSVETTPEPGADVTVKTPFRSDAPISIKADVLEAFDREGRKKFVFTGNVRAVQGDLHLKSDRLEAFYPPGKSQPERLVATGHVVITQTGKRALCEKATYFRGDEKLVCVGNAQLDEECDRVRGKEIVFHLDTGILEVNGLADVRIHPQGVACEPVDAAERASR
jgi:lipopolysaccharide export system protein LptA